jgi:hypothetical protein
MKAFGLQIFKRILLAFIIALILTFAFAAKAQENYSYNGSVKSENTIEKNKEVLLRWWSNFSDCSSKKIIDTVRSEKMFEVIFAGDFPVSYHMYGSTADGGIVSFKLKINLVEGSSEYRFYDLYHRSTVGVKHKDGGPLMTEKPLKGSAIFGRTWKSYQEQGSAFIHNTESEIIRVFK